MSKSNAEPPAEDSSLRASDADRDRFAMQLHEHFAEGRLTPEELDSRLDKVYAARTLVELYQITADLPHPGPRPVVGWTSSRRRRRWWPFG
jgi:hypothetical protein